MHSINQNHSKDTEDNINVTTLYSSKCNVSTKIDTAVFTIIIIRRKVS